jgi:hypothetical protein
MDNHAYNVFMDIIWKTTNAINAWLVVHNVYPHKPVIFVQRDIIYTYQHQYALLVNKTA